MQFLRAYDQTSDMVSISDRHTGDTSMLVPQW